MITPFQSLIVPPIRGLPQPNETHLGGLVRFQAYLIIHTLRVRVKKVLFYLLFGLVVELYCFGVLVYVSADCLHLRS